LEAVAEAFADSDVEHVNDSPEESADEVERSLLLEDVRETPLPPSPPRTAKRKRVPNKQKNDVSRRTKKRKPEESEDETYGQMEQADLRPKRVRRPLF
jgi:hypothetical protein